MLALLHSLRSFLSGDGALILPELELALFAAGILVIDRWLANHEKHWNAFLGLAGTAFSAVTLYVQLGKMRAVRAANPESPGLLGLHRSMVVDSLFLFFALLILAATAIFILLSVRCLEAAGEKRGSYYALVLFACAGLMIVASSVDALAVLLGLEIAAVCFYRLLRFADLPLDAQSAARSFAVFWAASSVALALGFLLLYDSFRTTNLGRIGAILDVRLDKGIPYAGLTEWHAVVALVFIAAGAFVLMDAAPLHWTAPSIYEFAPTPVAGLLGTAAKATAFTLLLRLFSFLFLFAHQKWIHVWGGAAILSLLWGNIAAIRQKNILRVLAYGSVAQTGFILLGIVAANEAGFTGMAYSIGTLVFSTAGVFGVIIVLRSNGARATDLNDLRGLLQRIPAAAWLLVLFVLALAGVPPAGGFIAKYYLVKGLLLAPHPELAAFTVANALLSAYAYARIAAHAFKKAPAEGDAAETPSAPIIFTNAQTVALTASAFVSLAMGLYPAPFLRIIGYVFGQ